MLKISTFNLFVQDQDEALAWYTEKLGFEVRADVTVAEMGGFRWLTVGPVEQPDIAVALMEIPGAPLFEPDTSEQLRRLMAKGVTGGLFFETDDCQARYEELRARGVEFVDTPEERPYGIDSGIRDPSGNHARIVQSMPIAVGA